MRLAGIGVLALFLVGILIYLGQSGAFDGTWQRSGGAQVARFDDANETVLANFDTDGSAVFGAPVVQDAPIILSGLPSYAGMEFRLPADARATSGDFDLFFTSLVAQDVEGVLRVSVNGVKRADYLLNEGEQADSLQIQLTPAELASGVVNVGLSLQGRGPIAKCSTDDAIAAVVNVSGSSGLRLNLSGTPQSAGDRLALWGDRVPVGWVSGDVDNAAILHQAAILAGKGYTPIFADAGTGLEGLQELASGASPRGALALPSAYPIPLTSDPVNEGLRKFTRRVNWRYSYNAGDLPDGRLPSSLDLRLQIGPSTDQLQRDVVVTLNDSLLFSRRIADGAERLNQSIAIPANLQERTNALDITVSAYDAQDLGCGDIVQSVAELLPDTVLQGGQAQLEGEISVLRASLARAGSVKFDASGLSMPDAAASAVLLSVLDPDTWDMGDAAGTATILPVVNGAEAARMPVEAGNTSWVIFTPAKAGSQVSAVRLSDANVRDIAGLALVVIVPSETLQQTQPSTGA